MNCRILRLQRWNERETEKERERDKIKRCEGEEEKFERQSYQVEKKGLIGRKLFRPHKVGKIPHRILIE